MCKPVTLTLTPYHLKQKKNPLTAGRVILHGSGVGAQPLHKKSHLIFILKNHPYPIPPTLTLKLNLYSNSMGKNDYFKPICDGKNISRNR